MLTRSEKKVTGYMYILYMLGYLFFHTVSAMLPDKTIKKNLVSTYCVSHGD